MDLTTLNLSDLPHIVAYIGVVCGMVFHVWKKWRQAGAERLSFLTTLKNWFLEKLLNTSGTALTALFGAIATVPMEGSLWMIWLRAAIVGITANSFFNRPGNGSAA